MKSKKVLSKEQVAILKQSSQIGLSVATKDYTKALELTDSMRVLIYKEFWINQDWSLKTVEIARITDKKPSYVSKMRRLYAPNTLSDMGRNLVSKS